MAFTENFAAFISTAEFAEVSTYTSVAGGGAVSVPVIFDVDYLTVVDGMAAGNGPAVHMAAQQVPAAARGDTWVLRGVTYTAVEVMPDGTGWLTVRLRK
jgi:hypothetical protein